MTTRTNRGFARLWAGSGVGNLADGILIAGLPVLATTLTVQPVLVAGVQVAFLGPMAIAALPSGVLADRHNRRGLLLVANAVRAVGLLVIAAATWREEWRLAAVYVAAMLAGSTEILADSAAETAVPLLVGPGGLQRAHSKLVGTQLVTNDAVGAPVGGWLATVGAGWLLAVPAGLYALTVALIAGLRVPHLPSAGPSTIRADIREGMVIVRRDPVLWRLGLANMAMNVGNTAFFAVFVLVVIGPAGLPRSAYGLLLAVFAAGGVVGSLAADRVVRRVGHAVVVRAGALVTGIAYAAVCLFPHVAVIVVSALLVGLVGMIWNITNRVLRQVVTPPQVLGRVTATMKVMALAMTPLGGVLGGVVAQFAGVRSVGVVAGGAALLALLAVRGMEVPDATDYRRLDGAAHG